jgi:cyclic lactone autoinducer peptide
MISIIIHKSSTLFQISLPFTKMAWIYKISGKEDPSMKTKLMMAVSALATVVAALAASSACFWWIYQPEEPSSLQDK